MCKNFMVIRHSIKELLAKSMVTRPMKCIVGSGVRKVELVRVTTWILLWDGREKY